MSNLKKLLIATIDAEISERGQSAIVLNTTLVGTLYAKHYSIQQIADCVVLEHYRFLPGFGRIAKQVYNFLTIPNDNVRKSLYKYLGAERLTYRHLNDDVFEARVQRLSNVYEFALEVMEEDDFVWGWLTSNVPSLGRHKPLYVLKDEAGEKLVMQSLNCIKYGEFS